MLTYWNHKHLRSVWLYCEESVSTIEPSSYKLKPKRDDLASPDHIAFDPPPHHAFCKHPECSCSKWPLEVKSRGILEPQDYESCRERRFGAFRRGAEPNRFIQPGGRWWVFKLWKDPPKKHKHAAIDAKSPGILEFELGSLKRFQEGNDTNDKLESLLVNDLEYYRHIWHGIKS